MFRLRSLCRVGKPKEGWSPRDLRCHCAGAIQSIGVSKEPPARSLGRVSGYTFATSKSLAGMSCVGKPLRSNLNFVDFTDRAFIKVW